MKSFCRNLSIAAILICTLLAGCSSFWGDAVLRFARPATAEGQSWVIYHDGTWQPVTLEGVQPPSYLAEHILTGGNTFIFRGILEDEGNTLCMDLEAWDIARPVRRQLSESGPPDTTSAQWLTSDDFQSVPGYQRFTYSHTSYYWPAQVDIYGAVDLFGQTAPADTTATPAR